MSELDPVQEAHLAPGGPALAGAAWFDSVVTKADLGSAWARTAPPLRLALVQEWMIETGRDAAEDERDAVAELVASGPGPAGWDEFATWQLRRWRVAFEEFTEKGWGLIAMVEPVRPDVVLVRFGSGREGRRFEPGEAMVAQAVTMQLVGGRWLVAGVGCTIAVPGWPPAQERLPTDLRG